jgi:diguanylate cyclase (GGDEF)-like protein
LIDLDDFKDVNDTLGHDAGDALLKEMAVRLTAAVRDRDTVARIGGDEFAVVLVRPLTLDQATSFAEILIAKLRQPFAYAERMVLGRASIGVAAFPDHDATPAELMKDADMALYRAKSQGRNCVVTYSSGLRKATEERVTLGRDVHEAISQDQIVPFYQPKVCLVSGQIVGFEALARWLHPNRGVLTPGYFGTVFDDPELAAALSERLISKVASDMRNWLDHGFKLGRVAVNLSSVQFNQPGLADEILGILEERNVSPQHFEIEVTETVFLGKSSDSVSATLSQFCERGVQIALDDFGTGYASLTHLKRFPVDHVKIDQSFVRDLEHDTDDEAIVSAVISLGRSLDLQVTAEGVETLGQAKRLRELGCHNAQGYLYARPMAGSEVSGLLSSWVDWVEPGRRLQLRK